MCRAFTSILDSSWVSFEHNLKFWKLILGLFSAELIIASVLTFQEVYQICGENIKTLGENMLGYIFTATDKRHGAQRLQTIVADKNCDLEKFIKDGNFDRWSEANVSLKGLRDAGGNFQI